jgi:hypothetical protein
MIRRKASRLFDKQLILLAKLPYEIEGIKPWERGGSRVAALFA